MGLPGQTGRTLESAVRALGSHGRVLMFVYLLDIYLFGCAKCCGMQEV